VWFQTGLGPNSEKSVFTADKRAKNGSKWGRRGRMASFFLHFDQRFPYNLRLLEALSSFLRFRILTDWGWYE
jgi:hypothetical protein